MSNGDAQAQQGGDSSPAAAVLTSAVFACAAEAVVCCPSSSALLGKADRSCLEAKTEPSHLECWRKQLQAVAKRSGRKKERAGEERDTGK